MAIKIKGATFLHIPKTGGTWLSYYFRQAGMVLDESELAHISGAKMSAIDKNEVVFCIVRHPLTWLRSWWQCKQKIVKDRRGVPIDKIVDHEFNKFVELFIKDCPTFINSFFSSYTEYCHFICKQESLREDLEALFKYAKINYDKKKLLSMENVNVIPSIEKYTIEQALKIMEIASGMAKLHGYNYIPLDIIK